MLRSRRIAAVACLFALALSLRCVGIGRPFSGDEGVTVKISFSSGADVIGKLINEDIYPPLTYLAVHMMSGINGSPLFIRLYFVFFGMCLCLLVYVFARRLFNEKAALIALAIAALSPLLIFSSQYVRSYADSAFWMLLSSYIIYEIWRGSDRAPLWAAYVISATLAVYTFYFSVLMIAAHGLFILAGYRKNMLVALKWAAAAIVVFALFMPWAPYAIRQLKNASIFLYDWSDKGIAIGPFKLGLFLRNLVAIAGFDPYFLVTRGGVTSGIPRNIALSAALLALACMFSAAVFLYRVFSDAIKKKREELAFILCVAFVPVAIAWLLAVFFVILPNARYLASFHAALIIASSLVIYNIFEKNRLAGLVVLAAIALMFLSRLPLVTSPEYDSKNASVYLEQKCAAGDVIACAESVPEGFDDGRLAMFGQYMGLNDRKNEYVILAEKGFSDAVASLSVHGKVWFYRVHGNVEVFGANDIIEKSLLKAGYSVKSVKRLKNIDVMEFSK